MTEDYTNQENKNFSPTFLDALKEIAMAGKALKEKVERVIEIGRNEGIPDLLIGKLIRNALSESKSISTIRRYLPDEMKEKKFANVNKEQNLGAQMSKIDDKNVIVESSIKKPKENDIRVQDNVIEQEPEPEPPQQPQQQEEVDIHKHCNERIARLDKEIEGLKEEIKRLQTENAELKKQLQQQSQPQPQPKPTQSSNNPSLFSTKTHDDYFKNKYRIKK